MCARLPPFLSHFFLNCTLRVANDNDAFAPAGAPFFSPFVAANVHNGAKGRRLELRLLARSLRKARQATPLKASFWPRHTPFAPFSFLSRFDAMHLFCLQNVPFYDRTSELREQRGDKGGARAARSRSISFRVRRMIYEATRFSPGPLA